MWLILNVCRGSPAAGCFLLLRQKKVTKEKATPVYRPCGVPSKKRNQAGLRNSHYVLRQSRLKLRLLALFLGGAQGKASQSQKNKTQSKTVCAQRTPNQKNKRNVWALPALVLHN